MRDADVWAEGTLTGKLERGTAPTPARRNTLPAVFLNHFYAVLDSCTYQAIEQNEFLRQRFASNETRTTTNADQTYTGLYFYGAHTYFEFFDVANSPRPRIGDTGLAFGVDQTGATEVLQELLGPELEPGPKLVTRLFQGKHVPWFFIATSSKLPYESGMSSWIMEYHTEFLANWNPQPTEANRGIRRCDILRRYSEVLPRIDAPILDDVIGLTVATEMHTRGSLLNLCRQLRYRIKRQKREECTIERPDFLLRIIPETGHARGVQDIQMAVRSPQPDRELQIGRSTLKFSGRSAIWSFG